MSFFTGLVDNVGPSGESAYAFSISGGKGIKQDVSTAPLATFGIYVRTDAGTTTGTVEFSNGDTGPSVTVGTDWTWVTGTTQSSAQSVRFRVGSDVTLYVLRAGLNRGSSLEYSTRSQVPQTIPDVVQGADLTNGSTDSADTNDLDFGVDAEGVPYAVSDGDDQTSAISQSNLPDATWAYRLNVVDPGDDAYAFTGQRSNYFQIKYRNINFSDKLQIQTFEHDGQEARSLNIANFGGPRTAVVVVTLDRANDLLRAHVDGNVYELDIQGDDINPSDPWRPVDIGWQGAWVSHVEQHPVLTEAEAEAVRQRLAGNPPDPVPVTEAWDFTAETSPHNLVKHSEDFSQWSGNATVTTDTDTAPDGTKTADTVEDTNSNRFSGVDRKWGTNGNNEKWTLGLFVEKGANPILELQAQVPKITQIQLDPDTGDIDKNRAGSSDFVNAGLIDYDENWWFIWLTVKDGGSTNPRVKIYPAVTSTLGSSEQSATGSNVFWGAQVVRGDVSKPEYVQTGSSIAFPQTVPSLRDSSNDLTLGSDPGADTNDGSWVAPIGMAEDGDDQLRAPTKRPTVTWVERIKYTATRAFGHSANGWKVTNSDLVVEDTGGNTASAAHGKTINDGAYHTLAVLIDEAAGTAELYIDGATSPDATVDLSTVGTLKSSDVELLAEGGTIKQPAYYTRALSGEEIAYLHERLVDNPQSAHPEYTTP